MKDQSLKPFHDYFRKQAAQFVPEDGLLYLCYLSAYDALPTAVARGAEEFWRDYYLAQQPALAWYTHMCLLLAARYTPFEAATFGWHRGRLDNGREYMIVEYPRPPELEIDEEAEDDDLPLLAPYFSAVLRTTTSGPAECYCMGQSPDSELATIRLCRSAAHYNLGYHEEPTLAGFLALLEEVQQRTLMGVTVRHKEHLDDLDRALIEGVGLGQGVAAVVEAQGAGVSHPQDGSGGEPD